VNVLKLILSRDKRARLLWEKRCDCTPERRLVCSVYVHKGTRHLYLPPLNGKHAATGAAVKTEPLAVRLDSGFAKVVDCNRCHSHYIVSSEAVASASAFIVIRLGLPSETPPEENQHVTTLKVPVDGAVEVMPGLFITPLEMTTFGQVAP
jgi:hypothetical protein